MRSAPIRAWPTTSPTGPRAPVCSRGTGAIDAADAAYAQAIGLEADPAVRRFLQQRREALVREVR